MTFHNIIEIQGSVLVWTDRDPQPVVGPYRIRVAGSMDGGDHARSSLRSCVGRCHHRERKVTSGVMVAQ